jgi:hypothetical protein
MGAFAAVIEEDPVVATAETKTGFRWSEFLHITGPIGDVAVNTVEDLDCGVPINGSQIGASFWRPYDPQFAWARLRSLLQSKLPQDLIMSNALAARQ